MPSCCGGRKTSAVTEIQFQDLARFVSCAEKQFDLPLLAGCFADERVDPDIPSRAAGLSLILGEVVQIGSLLQLEEEIKAPQWQRWVGCRLSLILDMLASAAHTSRSVSTLDFCFPSTSETTTNSSGLRAAARTLSQADPGKLVQLDFKPECVGTSQGTAVCAAVVTYQPHSSLLHNLAQLKLQVVGVIVVDNGSDGEGLLSQAERELVVQVLRNNGSPADLTLLGIKQTIKTHSALRRYYIMRNRILVYRRYALAFPLRCLNDLCWIFLELTRILFFEGNKAARLRNALNGVLHGLAGKSGKL
jgi:hypothetical protein